MADPLFDDLPSLLCFVRVVEQRSLSKAARALGVSKSVVSTRLAALEARLGERLVLRTTRSLSVTDAGLAVYASAVTMVEGAQRATREASDANRGVLRVSAPVTFAQMHLAEPLARFAREHPDTRLQLLLSDRIVDLTDERIDLAVRITKLKDSNLVARRLALTGLQVCAAPSYLEQHGAPLAPEDLLAHNCLRYSVLRPEHEWRLYGAHGRLPLAVRGNFETSSGAMLRAAALAGLGLAMLPRFMVDEDLRDGRLRGVLEGFMPRPLGIYAVQPERRAEPARVRQLVDILSHSLRSAAWT